MAEEKNGQAVEQPDFNQFYTVLEDYIRYFVQKPRLKLNLQDKSDSLQGERSVKEEIEKPADNYEEQRKKAQENYRILCESIANGGTVALGMYVDSLKKLYEDKRDLKRDIKSVLVNERSLKFFRTARKSLIDLYPILEKINKTFPVDDYSELSLAPKAAIYGSEVNKTHNGSIKKPPMSNEEIQAMLDLFIKVNDYNRFGDWFMAVMVFSPDQMVDQFQKEYIPLREQLKAWAYKQIESNDTYKHIVMDRLLKNKMLNNLVDAYTAIPTMETKLKELEDKVKFLEESSAKQAADHEDKRKKQYEIIQENNAELLELKQKVKDFDKCNQQLTMYMLKYQAQVDMNERITSDNERRIKETEIENVRLQDEFSKITAQLEQIESAYSALQSDFSLKNNELLRLKEIASQKEATARRDMMRELVSGINEQFYYLMRFYLELKDTGKLDPESIELYADTISNIDSVLADLGIRKIGVIDQKVPYDTSIYSSTDAKISNGEQVIVSGYGWKIGDDVYIKAPVEKGE